jgi:hypothetical protein
VKLTTKGLSRSLGERRSRALVAMIGAGTLAAALVSAAAPAAASGPHAAVPQKAITAKAVPLTRVRTVNLGALSKAAAAQPRAASRPGTPHVAPRLLPSSVKRNASAALRLAALMPHAALTTKFTGNVPGEMGFNGMTTVTNEHTMGFDITPPDMGLAAGTSAAGTAVLQYVNSSLQVFKPSGTPLTVPVSASTFFGIGQCSDRHFPKNCISDPRVYWDPQTKHWFIAGFTFGSFVNPKLPPGVQFLAVSRTSNALGSYTIFAIPMGQGFINPSDCPCVGDFDMIGADGSGFYLDVNEFGQTSYHGADLFAVSKSLLISAAKGGQVPSVFLYTVPTSADPFGGFRLAPSVVTQGSAAPNDEYFTEADANQFSDTSLEVWALLGTDSLNVSAAPPLVESNVATEGYSIPPPATQKAGPIPFGNSVGALVASPLDSGFENQQNTTFAGGNLYVQMGTGVNAGGGAANSGLAWFALRPRPGTSSVSVTNLGNGYVHVNGMLLYPSISVNARGDGYMGFATAGANRFPGAAYIRFNDVMGAVGPIHIAVNGKTPLDDFSCYPGICRYGDYSASNFFNGRLYFATEYVHRLTNVAAGARSNWATRVWSVPAATAAG